MHDAPAPEVLDRFGTDPDTGLSTDAASERLADVGPNKLPDPPRDNVVVRFLRHFKDVLIYVLLGAAVLTALLGEWVDTVVILIVVLVNATVGFVQEGRAEKAMQGIADMLSPTASVRRDGSWSDIDAADLVPGDIVRLSPGDRVPADLRLVEATDLAIEESALTGESVPADKTTEAVAPEASLGDREGMAFSSTMVTSGHGRGLVVGTGTETEIGRISTMMSEVETLETPLTRQIARFSVLLVWIVLVLAIVLVLVGWLVHGTDPADLLLAAVGFAVAAVPEGLPALITITLALGVQTMARHRAITRRLPAVQTLGSVTVICSDKTGTLTRNEMTVTHAAVGQEVFAVTGTGYAPSGQVTLSAPAGADEDGTQDRATEEDGTQDQATEEDGTQDQATEEDGTQDQATDEDPLDLTSYPALVRLGQAMGLANDTDLSSPDEDADEGWGIVGEPTEGALTSFSGKLARQLAGPDADVDPRHAVPGISSDESPRLATLPFSSDNKLMAVSADVQATDGSGRSVLVKGAPDRLLDRSTTQLDADGGTEPLDRELWESRVDELSGRGLRVLAAAERPATDADGERLTLDDLGEELTLVGMVGIVDPPRDEARVAVDTCHRAGIEVKMITGDHAGTAAAIAAQMGIDHGAGAVTGTELEAADDEELGRLAREHNVFARTSPEHKLRLVRALQDQGQVVAMTGDGVNDAPALRRADVGVAMGIKGTEVTKESAEVVLADDNFATIETAVEQGRRIYDNLRKAIVFLLPTNGAQSLVILSAVLIGATLPLTPLQVLWVNMVTAVTLAFAFAFEPAERGLMDRRPRDPDKGILDVRHVVQIGVVSILIAGITIAAFELTLSLGYDVAYARTVATTVLVACQAFYLFNVKALERSSLRVSVLTNNWVAWLVVLVLALLQAAFVYLPVLHDVFGTTALSALHVLYIMGIGAAVFLVTELFKLVLHAGRRS